MASNRRPRKPWDIFQTFKAIRFRNNRRSDLGTEREENSSDFPGFEVTIDPLVTRYRHRESERINECLRKKGGMKSFETRDK